MIFKSPLIHPPQILKELGIVEPSDIRIEAIAQYYKATVLYKKIDGAEARLVGNGDTALIIVNKDSSPERQRFSIAHELAHWMYDREKVAFACESSKFWTEWGTVENPEKRANRFAANLLMPKDMFKEKASNLPITFASVNKLKTEFKTSTSATAIRLVECGSFPSLVVCTGSDKKRLWFVRGVNVPENIWPMQILQSETVANQLLTKKLTDSPPKEVRADLWIDNIDAHKFWLMEDSINFVDGSALSLLWWKNEAQIIFSQNKLERDALKPRW